jgi:hypothetical protein
MGPGLDAEPDTLKMGYFDFHLIPHFLYRKKSIKRPFRYRFARFLFASFIKTMHQKFASKEAEQAGRSGRTTWAKSAGGQQHSQYNVPRSGKQGKAAGGGAGMGFPEQRASKALGLDLRFGRFFHSVALTGMPKWRFFSMKKHPGSNGIAAPQWTNRFSDDWPDPPGKDRVIDRVRSDTITFDIPASVD